MKKLSDEVKRVRASNEHFKLYQSGSYGTENYYRWPLGGPNFLITDGVKELIEKENCAWLADVVASYRPTFQKLKEDFVTCFLARNLDGPGALFLATDGNDKMLVSQEIEYTDIKVNVQLYLIFDGSNWVLLCTSEY